MVELISNCTRYKRYKLSGMMKLKNFRPKDRPKVILQ